MRNRFQRNSQYLNENLFILCAPLAAALIQLKQECEDIQSCQLFVDETDNGWIFSDYLHAQRAMCIENEQQFADFRQRISQKLCRFWSK